MAIQLGTTARVTRKFLRAKFGEVGKGARWAVRLDEIEDLKRLYGYWRKTDGRPRKGDLE